MPKQRNARNLSNADVTEFNNRLRNTSMADLVKSIEQNPDSDGLDKTWQKQQADYDRGNRPTSVDSMRSDRTDHYKGGRKVGCYGSQV